MTTVPFLSETDLATIAPLSADLKVKALTNFKVGFPPYSYSPVRSSFGDLLCLDTALFGPLPRVPFELIVQTIRNKARFEKEAVANIQVAAGMYQLNWRGRQQPFAAMGTSIGQRLTYWTPAVLAVHDEPIVPFFNPRRTALSPDARRFVFSMMHEQIREPNPADYGEVRLCICHFAATKTGPRLAKPCFDNGVELFSLDDLQAMVAETYAIWTDVWTGRVEELRRSGRGGAAGGGW